MWQEKSSWEGIQSSLTCFATTKHKGLEIAATVSQCDDIAAHNTVDMQTAYPPVYYPTFSNFAFTTQESDSC